VCPFANINISIWHLSAVLGTVGIILSTVGFIKISRGLLYSEGIDEIDVAMIVGKRNARKMYIGIICMLEFLFKISCANSPKVKDPNPDDVNNESMSKAQNVLSGALFILLGSLFQVAGLWVP
jgi:hypothetical protein